MANNAPKENIVFLYQYNIVELIRNALSDLGFVIAELIGKDKIEVMSDTEDLEIFHLASSFEKFTKALLPFIGTMIAFPSFVASDQDVAINAAKILQRIDLIPLDEKKLKKLSHKPISKSEELKELMISTKELLPLELRMVYDKLLNYMSLAPKTRVYEELENIIKEIDRIFRSLEVKIFLERTKMKISKTQLIKAEDVLITTELYKNALEIMAYMLYLEHAAGSVTRYGVGRDDIDERYLSDVREHKRQILDFIVDKLITLISLAMMQAKAVNDLPELILFDIAN